MPTPLEKRITSDHQKILQRVNAMYLMRTEEIGSILAEAFEDCVKTIVYQLSHVHPLNYSNFIQSGVSERIRHDVEHTLVKAAHPLQKILDNLRKEMDLTGRLMSAFVARKSTPPWIKVKIDLRSRMGHKDSRTSRIDYHLRLLAKDIHSYVMQGVARNKSIPDILKVVNGLFNRKKLSKFYEAKEATGGPRPNNSPFEDAYEVIGEPSIEMIEGVYTKEDIDRLQQDQYRALNMQHRLSRPWFSNSLKKNNQMLRRLEQDFMSDMIEALHQGMLQIGTDEMGIKDFEWVVSRPQPKCDECTTRDGKTMKWIKANIKDKFRDQPPPLHPNCRCQIVPRINDQWSKDVLNSEGYEFDSGEGIAFNPTAKQKKLGYKAMSWDDWLSNIPREAR